MLGSEIAGDRDRDIPAAGSLAHPGSGILNTNGSTAVSATDANYGKYLLLSLEKHSGA